MKHHSLITFLKRHAIHVKLRKQLSLNFFGNLIVVYILSSNIAISDIIAENVDAWGMGHFIVVKKINRTRKSQLLSLKYILTREQNFQLKLDFGR